MNFFEHFIAENSNFVAFSLQHWIAMALIVGLSIFLPFWAKRQPLSRQMNLSRWMAVIIAFWSALYIALKYLTGHFSLFEHLPLDICNIMALSLPFLFWNPNEKAHEIFYYWILAGTLNAIITPHLNNGFPHYSYFKYFIVHGGLVVFIIYQTIIFKFKLTWRNAVKAFFYLLAYFVLLYFANTLIGSNYGYVMHKPPVDSLLDYFGPWPIYILVTTVIGLVLFLLLNLPFIIKFKK